MDPLTASEKAQIKLFRERISDLLPQLSDFQKHDVSLIRFIRARDNLDKAEDMFRKHLEWRAKNDIDNILDFKTLDFEVDFPLIICGQDKAGFPAFVADIGRWDFRKAIEAGQKKQFIMYVEKYFEQFLKVSESLTTEDRVITQVFAIMDFEQFSFRQLASKDVIQAIMELVSVFEAQYPEILRAAYVINAPKVFQILWALIKPILTERTLSKVHIFGCNKESWKSDLKQKIDFATNFTSLYGGGINTCREYKFAYGTDVFSTITYEIFPEEEMTSVLIEAGSQHQVDFNMERGSKLSWNFKSEKCDVGFRLQYEEIKDVVKYSRVDSHLILQRGAIICQEPGRYTFTFDNSYSSFTGKEIKYCIRALDL